MRLARNPLLFEGVKKKEKRWKRAVRDLTKEARKARKKVVRRVNKLERGGASGQELFDAEDKARTRVFNAPKRAARLTALQDRETALHAKYDAANKKREEKLRRKQMLGAPAPTPVAPLTTIARTVVASQKKPQVAPQVKRRA